MSRYNVLEILGYCPDGLKRKNVMSEQQNSNILKIVVCCKNEFCGSSQEVRRCEELIQCLNKKAELSDRQINNLIILVRRYKTEMGMKRKEEKEYIELLEEMKKN